MAHDQLQRPVNFPRRYGEGHRTIKRKLSAAERAEYRAWIEALYQKAKAAADWIRFRDGKTKAEEDLHRSFYAAQPEAKSPTHDDDCGCPECKEISDGP